MQKPILHLLPALALLFAGCDDKKSTGASDSGSTASAPVPETLFLDAAPVDPMAIHVARTKVKPGDEVVLSGQVMGAEEPFVAGRAAFILGDREKLTPCNERPDDECPTPWDVCCDTKEAKRIGTATIQVLGDDKRVLKSGLEGVGGLEKLSRLVVIGTVAETSSADVLVVNASGIYVVP